MWVCRGLNEMRICGGDLNMRRIVYLEGSHGFFLYLYNPASPRKQDDEAQNQGTLRSSRKS